MSVAALEYPNTTPGVADIERVIALLRTVADVAEQVADKRLAEDEGELGDDVDK